VRLLDGLRSLDQLRAKVSNAVHASHGTGGLPCELLAGTEGATCSSAGRLSDPGQGPVQDQPGRWPLSRFAATAQRGGVGVARRGWERPLPATTSARCPPDADVGKKRRSPRRNALREKDLRWR
jgi:hypothetical protein